MKKSLLEECDFEHLITVNNLHNTLSRDTVHKLVANSCFPYSVEDEFNPVKSSFFSETVCDSSGNETSSLPLVLDDLKSVMERKLKVINTGKHLVDCVFSLLEKLCHNDFENNPSPNVSSSIFNTLSNLLKNINSQPVDASFSLHVAYISQRIVSLLLKSFMASIQNSNALKVSFKNELFSILVERLRSLMKVLENGNCAEGMLCTYEKNTVAYYEMLNYILGSVNALHALSKNFHTRSCFDEFVLFFNLLLDVNDYKVFGQSLLILKEFFHFLKDLNSQSFFFYLILLVGEIGSNVRNSRMVNNNLRVDEQYCDKKWKINYLSHHHSLQKNFNASAEKCLNTPCPVGKLTEALLCLLDGPTHSSVVMCSLLALNKCGMCCCTDLVEIYQNIFRNFHKLETSSLQELALHLLENSVIAFSTCHVALNCTVVHCPECETKLMTNRRILDNALASIKTREDSDVFEILSESESFKNGFWNVFHQYLNVIAVADVSTLLVLERHFSTIMTYSTESIQMELYLRVFLPLLKHCLPTHRSDGPTEEAAELVKFSLNLTIHLLKLPGAYCLLVKTGFIEKIFSLMCTSTLRHLILRLLRVVMLEESDYLECRELEYKKLLSRAPEMDMKSPSPSLYLYNEVLLHHTSEYANLIHMENTSYSFLRKTSTYACSDEIVGRNGQAKDYHTEDDLLECLTDLWKTVCVLSDRSQFYLQLLRSSNICDTVFYVIIDILQRHQSLNKYSNDDLLPHFVQLEWDLFGALLHVVISCRLCVDGLNEETFLSILQTLLSPCIQTGPALRVKQIFQALLTASLKSEIPASLDVATPRLPMNICKMCQYKAVTGDSLISPTSSESSLDYDADVEDNGTVTKNCSPAKLYSGANVSSAPRMDVVCPSALRLLLDLSVLYKNFLLKLLSEYENGVEDALSNLTWLIQILVSICGSSQTNAAVLVCDVKVTEIILNGLCDILTLSNPVCLNLQKALQELLISCSQYEWTLRDIKSYLKLFLKSDIPAKMLLETLKSLVKNTVSQPYCYVKFLCSGAVKSFEPYATHRFTSKRNISDITVGHRLNCLGSSWAKTAIADCFLSSSGESFWTNSLFTVCCWIKMCAGPTGDRNFYLGSGLVHLFSCGADGLMLELWFSQDTKLMLLKMTRSFKETYSVLDEKVLPLTLKANVWQHLCVSWKTEVKSNKKLYLTVYTSVMDGHSSLMDTSSLECCFPDSRGNCDSWVFLLGHCEDCEDATLLTTSWLVGPCMIFEDYVWNEDLAKVLYSLGADCAQFELIKEDSEMSRALKDKLVVTYLPTNDKTQACHSEDYTFHKNFESTHISIETSPVVRKHLKCLTSFNDESSFLKLGDFICVTTSNIETSIMQLGGPRVLILLFALIVDHFDDEDIQAECLSVIVHFALKSAKFRYAFLEISGWDLIGKVLATSKCFIGYKILSVLLDACITEPVLVYDDQDRHWKLNKITCATVTDVSLLTFFLKNWKIFHTRNSKIFSWVLKIFELLVQERHPKRDLNLKLLKKENVHEYLLNIFKERANEGDCVHFSKKVCYTFVYLLNVLCNLKDTGTHHLKTLLEFLLALHPPTKTYICHARSSMYFLPAQGIPKFVMKTRQPLNNQDAVESTSLLETSKQEDISQQQLTVENFSDTEHYNDNIGEVQQVNVDTDRLDGSLNEMNEELFQHCSLDVMDRSRALIKKQPSTFEVDLALESATSLISTLRESTFEETSKLYGNRLTTESDPSVNESHLLGDDEEQTEPIYQDFSQHFEALLVSKDLQIIVKGNMHLILYRQQKLTFIHGTPFSTIYLFLTPSDPSSKPVPM